MTILGRMLDLEEAWRECSTCELHRGEGYMNSYHGRMGMEWTNDMGKLPHLGGPVVKPGGEYLHLESVENGSLRSRGFVSRLHRLENTLDGQ